MAKEVQKKCDRNHKTLGSIFCTKCGKSANSQAGANPECQKLHHEYKTDSVFKYLFCPDCGQEL